MFTAIRSTFFPEEILTDTYISKQIKRLQAIMSALKDLEVCLQ